MLKQLVLNGFDLLLKPAAFRRLCVETLGFDFAALSDCPAAFRRLCVETSGVSDGH